MRTIVRYPGGKSRKAKEIIRHFNDRSLGLIEPMCGGAGVSLEYASKFPGAKIIISDLNPLVSSFWYFVVFDPESFCNLLEPMNLDVYRKYHELETQDALLNAMKFFVRNKCSFNGYIFDSATPVGGWEQKGKWKVDWCWSITKLRDDIMKVHFLLKDRTTVYSKSVFDLIEEYKEHELNWYVDPPYVKEGEKMYGKFGPFDHTRLATTIKANIKNFIISYDCSPVIKDLYGGCVLKKLSVNSSRKLKDGKLRGQTEYLVVPQKKINSDLTLKQDK